MYICIRNNAMTQLVQAALLWIAFKICVYLHQKQRADIEKVVWACCELLSKFVYICIRNNTTMRRKMSMSVVNCFQNLCIFASETTRLTTGCRSTLLWIAFKICVYLHQKQPCSIILQVQTRCELLSKFVYIYIRNNTVALVLILAVVVNCFQNLCIFASETTRAPIRPEGLELWIAFKICVYLHQKQHTKKILIRATVVNCFQNLCIFASETTNPFLALHSSCCELLSKFVYICIRNNIFLIIVIVWPVVNCFQNLCIFASETTVLKYLLSLQWLWIAFKICVYLHQKQQSKS